MNGTCTCCQYASATHSVFCSDCLPRVCYDCRVGSITITDETVTCSRGCTYSVSELVSMYLHTVFMNGTVAERLQYAGDKVELICQDVESINVFSTRPPATADTIRGIHFTPDTQELCDSGFSAATDTPALIKDDEFAGTVRENAVYAWPYTQDYCNAKLGYKEDFVYVRLPKADTVVSSYRYLEWLELGARTGEYVIPADRYEDLFVFDPDLLFRTVRHTGRPCEADDLQFFN